MATKRKKKRQIQGKPLPLKELKERFPSSLPENLKRYMLFSGESKIDLAEYLKVTRSSVYKWIDGQEIMERHVLMLADHWGTTPASLRYGAPEIDVRVLKQVFQALRLHQQDHPRQNLSTDQEASLFALLYENAMNKGVIDMSHLIGGFRGSSENFVDDEKPSNRLNRKR